MLKKKEGGGGGRVAFGWVGKLFVIWSIGWIGYDWFFFKKSPISSQRKEERIDRRKRGLLPLSLSQKHIYTSIGLKLGPLKNPGG